MSSTHPNLTLVPAFAPEDVRVRATRQLAETRRRIALENRLASNSSHLDTSDLEEMASPHLVLAGRIAASLEGAVLPPERRQDLLRFSKSIGVREFDASLVIAVIQDRARRGESMDDIVGPLEIMAARGKSPGLGNLGFVTLGAGLGIAIGLATLLVQWLTRA
ncbi:MAG: hypothetical protein P8J59_05510 [Phycisphaerales bacterium]|jgi:hypothetical protein|nr:hypothetical protein [Phycisphaerales bacterium]